MTAHDDGARPIGFATERLAVVDLAREIGQVDGHVLRMSRTTIAPGGSYAPHSHAGRPELIYILDGVFTDGREGRFVDYGPGSIIAMTDGVTHSIINRNDAPVTYISVTIRVP